MKIVNSTDSVSFFGRLAASLIAIMLVVLPACSGSSDDAAADRDSVVVTIFPIFDLTQRIAGDAVEVRLLLSPGLSPHSYSASPADANALNEARLLIANGGGVDDWIAQPWRRRQDDGLRLLHLSSLVGGPLGEFDLEQEHDDHDHAGDAHEHEGEHDHGPFNPHRWLVPRDAQVYVEAIEAALVEAFPDHAAGFRERADALLTEIEAVDKEYASRLTGFENPRIVTFHDAFTPLAEAYGVEVAASIFSIESRQVSPAVLQRVSQRIENEGVRAVYIEPQFNPEAAQRLGELVTLRTLDPIGDPGRSGYDSWTALMRSNLDALVEGLRENDSGGGADSADTGETDG